MSATLPAPPVANFSTTLDSILGNTLKPFSDLKIVGLRADEAACGNYRVTFPLKALEAGGATVKITDVYHAEELYEYDFILAQRQYSDAAYADLKNAQLAGKTLIYEIDDNVHAVHPNSVAYQVYRPGGKTLRNVDRFLSLADGFFTTSYELASQYRQKCQRVWVLPNQIDYGNRPWADPAVQRDPRVVELCERLERETGLPAAVIGWAGSITHQDDAEVLGASVRRVLERHPNACFVMVSAYMVMDIFERTLGIPKDRILRLEPVEFPDYPPLLKNFDISLAPVTNTVFNRAKSSLKLLEAGAWGIPYVASKIAPYQRFHAETEGRGGFLARTTQEWEGALDLLVRDPALRQEQGAFMGEYIASEYNINRNAHLWAEAFREARFARQFQPETVRTCHVSEKPGRNEPCPCGSGKKYKKCSCFGAWG